MAEMIRGANDGKKWELIRGASTFEQFAEEFIKLPFASMKTLTPKECRFSMQEHGTSITVTAIHKVSGRRASATGSAAQKQVVKSDAMMKLTILLFGPKSQ